MLQAMSEVKGLEGLSIRLAKNLPYKMQGALKEGVLVAVANDLGELVLILQGKGFLTVIKVTKQRQIKHSEAEGKANRGKSVLFNLKDTSILYSLLNSTDRVIGNFY